MKPRNAVRALIMAVASIAMCALAVPAHAMGATPAAGATGTRALAICAPNDLCLFRTNGTVVVVPSGQSRSFNPPLAVDQIYNRTSLDYCVEVGLIIYLDVKPNQLFSGLRTVYGVMPGQFCPG